MKSLHKNISVDRCAGVLMFFVGMAAAVQSAHYRIGSLSKMGPGFFPAAVGTLLALVGIAIFMSAKRGEGFFAAPAVGEDGKRLPSQWRGWILISLSLVAFIVLGTYGGLVPATFAIVFISALADRQNSLKSALLLALTMVGVCVVVFWWLLQVQFPLFRWG